MRWAEGAIRKAREEEREARRRIIKENLERDCRSTRTAAPGKKQARKPLSYAELMERKARKAEKDRMRRAAKKASRSQEEADADRAKQAARMRMYRATRAPEIREKQLAASREAYRGMKYSNEGKYLALLSRNRESIKKRRAKQTAAMKQAEYAANAHRNCLKRLGGGHQQTVVKRAKPDDPPHMHLQRVAERKFQVLNHRWENTVIKEKEAAKIAESSQEVLKRMRDAAESRDCSTSKQLLPVQEKIVKKNQLKTWKLQKEAQMYNIKSQKEMLEIMVLQYEDILRKDPTPLDRGATSAASKNNDDHNTTPAALSLSYEMGL